VQNRTRQNRQIDSISGAVRNTGSATTESRDIVTPQSRTVTVSGSGWRYSSYHSYGGYSPATSGTCIGTTFTQTEGYKERQAYTYSYSVGGTHVITRDENRSRTRSAAGSKVCENWVSSASYSLFTPWSVTSITYGTYSPAATNQSSNFTQSRTNTLNKVRYEQVRQYDTISGAYRLVGEQVPSNTTSPSDQSRLVTVSSSGYVNYGGVYSCGSYSPATSTVDSGTRFTQTRTCRQGTRNTYSFSIGGSHFLSSSKYVTTTTTATGTKAVLNCSGTFEEWEESDYGRDETFQKTWEYPDGGSYEIRMDRSGSISRRGTEKPESNYTYGATIDEYLGAGSSYSKVQLCILQ
jgi:hypothetical protein